MTAIIEKNRELVLAENKLQSVQDEILKAQKTRDTLQSQIEQKTADYNIYMAQRDTETKNIRQATLENANQLVKDKAEFTAIAQAFQKEKEEFKRENQILEADRTKVKAQMDSIQSFITALKRDLSVLGI